VEIQNNLSLINRFANLSYRSVKELVVGVFISVFEKKSICINHDYQYVIIWRDILINDAMTLLTLSHTFRCIKGKES
jgi:hypothetical protein